MLTNHVLMFAGLSLSIAMVAALRRSQLILIVTSLNMAVSSSILLLTGIARATGGIETLIHAFVILVLSTLANLIFCGVIILIFRSRGTLRLDDYRELRG